MFYCIKIKTTTDLYRFIRLRFDKITDIRNMQIFDKVYQTGVSGGLRCCTYLADTDFTSSHLLNNELSKRYAYLACCPRRGLRAR